jgi:hypothetical protein
MPEGMVTQAEYNQKIEEIAKKVDLLASFATVAREDLKQLAEEVRELKDVS